MMRRWNKVLGSLLFCMVIAPCGCQSLGAWMGGLSVGKDGSVKGELESAGKGGNFNKNTGLNVTAGDNSLIALALVVAAIVVMPFVYPLQRALRLRREVAAVKRQKQLREVVNGSACLGLLLLLGCAAVPPAQGRSSGPVVFEDATAGAVDFDRRVYRACRQAVHDERMAALQAQRNKATTPKRLGKKLRLEN